MLGLQGSARTLLMGPAEATHAERGSGLGRAIAGYDAACAGRWTWCSGRTEAEVSQCLAGKCGWRWSAVKARADATDSTGNHR
jgi:hypothetical protein